MKIAVLGAGMVGSTIALDLAKVHSVTSFDNDVDNLIALKNKNGAIESVNADLQRFDKYNEWLTHFDIVVTAVPGFMGYKVLEAAINVGKNVVDISFFPEDAMQLHQLAKEKNVTVITDCGVAPGMSNFILGRYNEEMKIDSFEFYVGGLPLHPKPPFFYKAPFSPMDVIEEYIRPARMIENGQIISKPALSEREIINFDSVGALEAFNTDGLRSLIETMGHIPNLKEKTLRWPGHLDFIIALKNGGLLDDKTILVNNKLVSQLETTTNWLIKEWKLVEGEEEFTIMKIILKSKDKTITYNLFDQIDSATQTTSMARTTGYTCTAAVNLIAQNLFTEKGVFPPELVGKHANCFDFVLNYLKDRNVNWKMTEKSF